MRRIITLLAAFLVIAASSQAHAYVLKDWTLNTTGIGGTDVVTGIDSIGMNGIINLVQNTSGGPGTPAVGDTFSITNSSPNTAKPVSFMGVSYNSGGNVESPLLTSGKLTLTTPTPLTGAVTSVTPVVGGNIYTYSYANPGANTVLLTYTDATNTAHTIATFTINPTTSNGTVNTTQLTSLGDIVVSSAISGTMTVVLAGVLFDSSHNDLFGHTYSIELGQLSGGNTYAASVGPTTITATGASSNQTFQIAVVPEPSSLLLLGSGVFGAAFLKRKNRRIKTA